MQAIPAGPWATYPDLLRVPTNQNSQITEDDAPESQLSFSQRVRQSVQNQNQSSNGNSGAIVGAQARETGAIPKARPAPPPDVSLPGPSATAVKQPADVIPAVVPSLRANHPPPADRLSNLEREVVSLQTQRAVLQQQLNQRENQLRDLRYQAQHCEPVASSLASVAASVAAIQQTMDTMARDLTERLNRLESRLNKLTVVDNQSNFVHVDPAARLREELSVLRDQQRRVSAGFMCMPFSRLTLLV